MVPPTLKWCTRAEMLNKLKTTCLFDGESYENSNQTLVALYSFLLLFHPLLFLHDFFSVSS